ncbi:OmcA/MtrC family decaheme c-type cytochrome [Geothrix terrae]|uniref:OmcA/MtrC family decaheme c-type cytochrome n=1 Tax=Geothrix terrae TaxID=2922720 RepID=UPI001FAC6298|nr:OmcA/MtrC family decaheme c-type cytochrome [Geothrix terrae]
MQHRPLKHLCGAIAATTLLLALIACDGKTGPAGANGTNGTNGANGTNGTNGTNAVITVNAAQLTSDQWAQLTLKGTVNSVTMGSAPVVNFTITDGVGTPVSGLAAKAASGNYTNFAFAISKLVPGTNGSPSRWVCYNVVTTPAEGQAAVPGFTEPENNGTLKDNLDGTYTYTFALDLTKAKDYVDGAVYDASHLKSDLDDLTYDPTLTHRMMVTAGGAQPGTTTQVLSSANLYYDFIPSTGKPVAATDTERVIVDTASCNACHTKLSMHANFFPAITDTHLCVVCHTDQLKYASGDSLPSSGNVLLANGVYGSTQKLQGMALANFPNMVHHIHTGDLLYYQGYNQFLPYNEVTYPQDLRNCTKCHTQTTTTPQGDNWTAVPSRLACGGCHDSIIWVSGVNHAGGAQTNDQKCVSCHGASQMQVIHTPVVVPNANNGWLVSGGNNNTNASYVAGYTGILPSGAHIVTWDFKSVSLNASRQPVFVFRFLEDGLRKDFKTFVDTTTTPEFWDNYAGGPSVYLAFSVPQDGIATPADWNATVSTYVKNIWRGDGKDQYGNALAATQAGTLAGPDTDGYYTLTMTGVAIPATAINLTGGIGYTYGLSSTQPLTQTNVAGYAYMPLQVTFNTTTSKWVQVLGTGQGGVSVPAPNVIKQVSGSAARRAIVSNQKCNDCHATLGIFTEKVYHAGQRNDAPTCTFCHNVNRVNSGWGVNIKDAVHAIHAADKRANKYSWEVSAGDYYWEVTYPAILNNCEACHVPGSYDFRNSASQAALPNLLWTTVATGTMPATINYVKGDGTDVLPGTYYSPFVTAGTAYGSGFATNFATGSATPYTDAAPTTLVSSPITAACSSCHDSTAEIAHFRGNGGAFYEPRATALLKVEQCMVCHGPGRTADIKAVHMTFK